jgi:hypothetical protein
MWLWTSTAFGGPAPTRPPLAAGIFLDVLNMFLLFLRLFGRSN